MIKTTADLLGKFCLEDELKFLVHCYSKIEEQDFCALVTKARLLITESSGLIPDQLYDLLFGFVYGPEWVDWKGKVHSLYCGSKELIEWYKHNEGVSPMEENSPYVSEFQDFKNSIRTYRNLPGIIEHAKEKAPSVILDVDRKSLKHADFYTDVLRLKQIIERILTTMCDPRFIGPVKISSSQQEDRDGYRVMQIIIEQKNDYAQPSLKFIRERLATNSGDLGSIKKLLEGVAYWSIESDWEEGSARFNVTSDDIFMNQFERINEQVGGFRHILTFYHKTF